MTPWLLVLAASAGSGLIVVPALLLLPLSLDGPTGLQHVAVATSLAAMIPTTAASLWTQYRVMPQLDVRLRGHRLRPLCRVLLAAPAAGGAIFTDLLGVRLAHCWPTARLKRAFARRLMSAATASLGKLLLA